jgi:glycyl-tRNA synthetase beta chain
MAQLLIELFSEEIPARMQARGADELKRLITAGLKDSGLDFEDAHAYATPRRLALVVNGLPETQPDVREEKRGPRADAPKKAIDGFLKANGITADDCETRDTGKGKFLFAVIERKGRATAELAAGMVGEAIAGLPWAKSMRWGSGRMRWVRPLARVVCVFDGEPVALELEGGIPCSNLTSGHRVHGPDEFDVGFFKDYRETLYLNKVIVDAAERRRVILERATELAEAEGLELRDDPLLLDEVAGLVEWPVVLIGTIDVQFMGLPDEVLSTSMRTHQKYFSLQDPGGALAPRFIVVANVESSDGGAAIVAGNERVLRARLADAKFFWDRDRKQKLEDRAAALSDITFHEKLGTVADKVARIEALAAEIAAFVPGCDADAAREAARLCKADLTTGMVGEFPGLQGIMGRYYAAADGVGEDAANAIADHYSPAGPNDVCPTAPVSVALALADRIDTLVGFWAIDEKPTGSRDPFALRRAALGVIRLVLENNLRISLTKILHGAYQPHEERVEDKLRWDQQLADDGQLAQDKVGPKEFLVPSNLAIPDLLDFFADRLKVHLRDKGMRHDLISAVFALSGEDDLVRLMARVEALAAFLDTDDGANLLTAHKRAGNIVAIEEKKDGADYGGEVEDALFAETEERELAESLSTTREMFGPVLEQEKFGDAMAILARLRGPVDAFFDHVTVNCDDANLRANRLRLLSGIRTTMNRIADFSEIEG